MKYSEQFMEHTEYIFAAFCNVVLRNAAINAYRDFERKQKREVSLDYLMSETPFEPFSTDNYFEQYVYEKPTVFGFAVGQSRERKRINRLRSQFIVECYAIEIKIP